MPAVFSASGKPDLSTALVSLPTEKKKAALRLSCCFLHHQAQAALNPSSDLSFGEV